MPGDDEQDKAGILASPPLIYLPALVFGLLLNRRFPIAFLPDQVYDEGYQALGPVRSAAAATAP